MLNFFQKILLNFFQKKSEKESFVLIKSEIKKYLKLDKISNIFYLGGEEYSDKTLKKLKESNSGNILDVLDTKKFNTLSNNIDLYYIEYNDNEFYIFMILSPYEYWENEKVIDYIKIEKMNLELNNNNIELIYNNPLAHSMIKTNKKS